MNVVTGVSSGNRNLSTLTGTFGKRTSVFKLIGTQGTSGVQNGIMPDSGSTRKPVILARDKLKLVYTKVRL